MSLDCYPFGVRQTIGLAEQPMAIDVAYDDDLFICITDNCRSVAIFELNNSDGGGNLIKQFNIGEGVVVDQVVYCKTGDYIACVGHNDGLLSLYTTFRWRTIGVEPIIKQLNLGNENDSIYEPKIKYDKRARQQTGQQRDDVAIKINSIDSCQRTGNLAVSLGDIVRIYKLELMNFQHIISIKLSIIAMKICLVENYLSITTTDHIQILKLELLTLQILPDADQSGSISFVSNAAFNRVSNADTSASDVAKGRGCVGGGGGNGDGGRGGGGGGDNVSNNTNNQSGTTASTSKATTTCSMISDSNSTIGTNFSTFNECHDDAIIDNSMSSSNDDCITWNLNTKKLVKLPTLIHNTSNELSTYHICHPLELLGPASESIACRVEAKLYSQDYCRNQLEPIVMLCKQFDLDHEPIKSAQLEAIYLSSLEDQRRLSSSSASTNNSNNINSCTVGQASGFRPTSNQLAGSNGQQLLKSPDYELISSVTCFVATLTNCFVYSLSGKKVVRIQSITHPDLCLDFRPDLLNVYLLTPMGLQICSTGTCDAEFRYNWSSSSDLNLNFVACNQTWRCLTSRSYIILLSSSVGPSGCSATDSTRFHLIGGHDYKSANSATDGANAKPTDEDDDVDYQCCLVEFMRKPSLIELGRRIVNTVERCNSISIRSNLLTYLHASAQLELFKLNHETITRQQLAKTSEGDADQEIREPKTDLELDQTISLLKWVTIFLCKQLIQKKQTNVITNQKLDKQIKHLLDISYCNLAELMKCYLDSRQQVDSDNVGSSLVISSDAYKQRLFGYDSDELLEDDNNGETSSFTSQSPPVKQLEDEEGPVDFVNELIKIYLKHAKHSQPIVDYLISITCSSLVSTNDCEFATAKLVSYLYNLNPRLLIKCAQKYTNQVAACDENGPEAFEPSVVESPTDIQEQRSDFNARKRSCLRLLSDKLKQLAELDSTGINRATVLLTLAILHHQLGHQDQCLAYLAQIKPLKHLAITMCSNYEISHPIANLVARNEPKVFELFLNGLTKRDPIAARQFEASRVAQLGLVEANGAQSSGPFGVTSNDGQNHRLNESPDQTNNDKQPDDDDDNDNDDDGDDDDDFEQRLRLVADIAPVELADLLIEANVCLDNDETGREAIGSYLKASINLLEAQFILARLCENSR